MATNYLTMVETNLVPVFFTNLVPVPVMNLVGKIEAEAGINAAGSILNMFLPGIGSIVVLALGGLYHGYRQIRNRKVNEALIQGVETARVVLETTPQTGTTSSRSPPTSSIAPKPSNLSARLNPGTRSRRPPSRPPPKPTKPSNWPWQNKKVRSGKRDPLTDHSFTVTVFL